MCLWLLTISILYLLVQTHAQECPSNPGLYEILEKHVLDVDPKALVGTWMDVMVPKVYLDTVASSYSIFKLEKDEEVLKVEGHDFLLSGINDVYHNTFKKIHGGRKGSFTFTGSYRGGKEFVKQAYFFYVDNNVIAFYSCDVDIPLESGWDLFILVNGDKREEFQAQKDTSEAMKSFKKAKAVMDEIAEADESWAKKNEDDFGLMGEMGQVNFDELRVSSDPETLGTEKGKATSNKDQTDANHSPVKSQELPSIETASGLNRNTGTSNTPTISASINPSAGNTDGNVGLKKEQPKN